MNTKNIAVIGSGISGLSAAWLLSKKHDVTLLEADDRLGGHTNTVDMDVNGQTVAVDTGFICFNTATYPNLVALFDHLDVPVHDTTMGFAVSRFSGGYEYSGGSYSALFGQRSNIAKPSHWLMIRDILRFFREAAADLDAIPTEQSLGDYLASKNYSRAFIENHLLPMGAAIWSSDAGDVMDYPARAFISFFQNHALLQVEDRPKWGTVVGGSRTYLNAVVADGNFAVQTNAAATSVVRHHDRVDVHGADGVVRTFDDVVIATHADQALNMLDAPSAEEQRLLGSFRYTPNRAVLHRDPAAMPKRRRVWDAWNYIDFDKPGQPPDANSRLCLSYWMNALQDLGTDEDIFVTLNPPEDMELKNVAASFDYAHPLFDEAALNAQQELWSLQGTNRTWFCGAHFGSGFHEDGLQSGLAVAEQLGGVRRPWEVENESGRITISNPAAQLQAAE
ncbi:NAD(P)/FAD-dependent oxidoreductase [Ahrensia sp. R2A130]|uniref:NAD(P)/FAD-dependent oxidoreductase n=1 Tax=Ahrensia sp. R2A130 TaxID=744979 RepID=UPI0018DEC5A6|nr:FAD-dependent oxidoreductase [Ahrensia sp. R2A130]